MALSSISVSTRDLRLDFFRGLALLTIFVNHIPFDPLGEITPRNFGFSDATEVFIFLSGFSAAMVYGRILNRDGYLMAAARIAKRVWQLFVAHIFMMVMFCAMIAWAAHVTGDKTYLSDMFVTELVTDPAHALPFAAILGFQPAFMNILPMYIVVLALFIPMIALLHRNRLAFLTLSLGLYAVIAITGFDLPVYPNGIWYFNPLAWQALFMLGALFGYRPAEEGSLPASNWIPQGRVPLIAAVSYLTFSLIIVLSWRSPALAALIPQFVNDMIYPLSKTNLSVWRLLHFLATAYVALRFVPAAALWLRDRAVDPILACGRHALEVFCLGIFLSFAGRLVLLEIDKSMGMTLLVNATGFTAMFAMAYLLDWYKNAKPAKAVVRPERAPQRAEAPALQPAPLDGIRLPAPQA